MVTPVTPLEGSFQKDPETDGVTIGVTVPDEVAERVAVMEIDGGLARDIAVAVAIFERILPPELMDTLARFADEQVIRVHKGGRATDGAVNSRSLQDNHK